MVRKLVIALAVVLALAVAAVLLIARSLLGSESVRARVQEQIASLTGQPVTVGAANARVFPRVSLELAEVTIGEPAAIVAKRITIATGLRGLLARRVEDAEVVLSDATLTLPLRAPLVAPQPPPPAPASTAPASPPADAAGAQPGPAGFTIASVRVISAENLVVDVAGKRVRLDLQSALEGDRLDVSRLTARSDRASLEARGAIESLRRLEGSFTVTGNPLDLDELLALSAGLAGSRGASAKSGAAPADRSMRLKIDLTAPAGTVAGYAFSKLAATVAITPATIALTPVSFGMFGGTFEGTMQADPQSEPLAVEGRGTIGGMDVAALAAAAGSAGAITGRLNARVSLAARGVDGATLLKTLRASAEGAVVDGNIPGLDMVRTVILAFGKPSGAPPPGSGSAFSRPGGTFQLANGTLASSNLALASRDFDLLGKLVMTVPGARLDARADVILSEELTKQAGTDLRRYAQEDGRVVLPARITGTLAQPVVTVDVAAAMGRALQNELKRRGRSLIDQLFKKRG
jgi:uncharacterized protein involved in outer membrane biogenesis